MLARREPAQNGAEGAGSFSVVRPTRLIAWSQVCPSLQIISAILLT
jgi:hypothetical protein